MTDKVPIRQLPTEITGLDKILGGGVPEFSFNIIAGPGEGTSEQFLPRVFDRRAQATDRRFAMSEGGGK